MKKTTLILAIVVILSIIAIILPSCTVTNSPSPSPSSSPVSSTQPPVTVTTTQTATVTVTQTPAVITVYPNPPPTVNTTPSNTPPASSVGDVNNNAHFFIGQDISGYTKTVNPDGSVTQSPVKQDLYLDLDLGGFYTQNEATFVPKIPDFTDQDQWILKFTVPTFKLPLVVNWGNAEKIIRHNFFS